MNKITDIKISSGHQVPDYGPEFSTVLEQHEIGLTRGELTDLQINLGKLCNLACHHCHVDAGPKRTEIMQWETMQRILDWIKGSDIKQVDLTGGAPELNPHFREFCDELIKQDISIISRCNITVLFEPEQDDLAEWYAQRKIKLVCSLPCYSKENVDAQRGDGTFEKSIAGLKELNTYGYGEQDDLILDLVYNPGGAFLPPEQTSLEQDYRQLLDENFGISFSNLLTITNIPINRFAHGLRRDGELEMYQQILLDNFNVQTVENLMCRNLINLDWNGRVYDCDFNQMLDMPFANKKRQFLWDLKMDQLSENEIATDRHCFGCTAGSGSSCGGAIT